jgi:hypothetical protein
MDVRKKAFRFVEGNREVCSLSCKLGSTAWFIKGKGRLSDSAGSGVEVAV